VKDPHPPSIVRELRASAGGVAPLRLSPAGWWLLGVACFEAAVALSIRLPMVFGQESWISSTGPRWLPAVLTVLPISLILHAVWRFVRQQDSNRVEEPNTALTNPDFATGCEWQWVAGADGRFTFSSRASLALLGYEDSELLGQPCSLVIDFDELVTGQKEISAPEEREVARKLVPVLGRRRDGTRAVLTVSFRSRPDGTGRNWGFEETSRSLSPLTIPPAAEEIRTRVQDVLTQRKILTAFQPIRCLGPGAVIGAEALTRFIGSPVRSADLWFTDAASVDLGLELEFLAMETALLAATQLPRHLYVSINLSPRACLDPRLNDILQRSGMPPARIVLELTERFAVADYKPLVRAMDRLRESGVRIAVDDAGAGFASMRHILQLKPDLIKLDRSIISGIDADAGRRALGGAMVSFAAELGAILVAEGIETETEHSTVTELGMNAGQGYLLGRPSLRAEDWLRWQGPHPGCRHVDVHHS
jgi:PAS domain S-box-containing protein